MSNIDYVVISSDDNLIYKEFYPIVAKRWFDLGFKTLYINITDKNEKIQTDWGLIYKIKRLQNSSSGFQSQIVRLFSSNLVDGNILISDIDMLPISSQYFENQINLLTEDNIVLSSGQPYVDVPYFPMCYVISNTKTLRKKLGIDGMNFESFCEMIKNNYTEKWNADENFLYDRIINTENLIINRRNFENRIDRTNWSYDITKLKNGYYIDSHLLRPYSVYQNQINKLINDI